MVASLAACGDDLARVSVGRITADSEVRFDQTAIGRSSQRQFEIRNRGDGDLTISSIEIVDASPYIQFSSSFMSTMAIEYDWRQQTGGQTWLEHPPFVMGPGRSIQVDLVFSPASTNLSCPGDTDPSQSCGRIVIISDDKNNSPLEINIALSQSSGSISVDPTVLQFPDVVGGPYTNQFVITNVGTGPLSGIRVTPPGVQGITLQESSNRPEPFTLGQGETSTYIVTFTPVSGVDYCNGGSPDDGCTLGGVEINSNDAVGATIVVTLLVGGISSPDIDVNPTELIFNTAAVGSPESKTVDVSNTGGTNLNWNLRIDPASVRDVFALEVGGTAYPTSGAQMTPLGAGNTATVEVTLDPTDNETVRGELVITAVNDLDEPITRVDLYGGAPAPELEVSPTQLYFHDIAPGASADLQFVISNTGRSTLNISSGDITLSTEFSVSPNLSGQTVVSGGLLPVTVTYSRPENDLGGLDHGVLTIVSDALGLGSYTYNLFAYHETTALPPTAVINASGSEPYSVGETITLDATNSTPPAGGSLPDNPYGWTLITRPAGSTAELSNNYQPQTTLTPDVTGTYTVMLTVTAIISETVTTQNQVTRNLLVQ